MARKKKKQAQEVQKLTYSKLHDTTTAMYLIKKAAAYYGKPVEETTLEDGFNMMHEQALAEKIEGLIPNKDNAELDEITGEIIKTAAELTGKDISEITISDIENIPGLKETLSDTTEAFKKGAGDISEMIAHFAETISATINDIFTSPEYNIIETGVKITKDFITSYSGNAEIIREIVGELADKVHNFEEMTPFILLEIAERAGDTEHLLTFNDICEILKAEGKPAATINNENVSKELITAVYEEFETTLEQFTFTGDPKTEYAREILAAAGKRRFTFEENAETVDALKEISESITEKTPDIEKIEQIRKDLPRIIAQSAESLNYPLDKPNSVVWNLLSTADKDGQLSFEIDTAKKGSGKEALIYYSIDFAALESLPELNITKHLTPFDKRVYIIAAALYNAGNEVITATQIYKADHNTDPSDQDINKINDSLTKMGAAHIYIDNKNEVNTNKKYPKFKYDASLLPFERMSAYINGQLSEAAIHLLREPPLITFAKERKQITTIEKQLLFAPVSKTDANLQLEDYLLERIGHMKSPKSNAPRKMIYTTIYERCGINGKSEKDRKQRQRTPAKIKKYLDHYIKQKWIKGYKEEKDGIIIEL